MWKIPLVYPRFTDQRTVSAAPCHYLENKVADSVGNESSESGWTMYFDHSVDRERSKNSCEFDILRQNREVTERYPTYYYPTSSFTSNEEDPSMASDASSGPPKLSLSLPGQDIGFERQGAGSYSSVSIRKQDVRADNREDLESVASCLSAGVNPRKNEFRKLNKNEQADLLFQDTASSFWHCPEGEDANAHLEHPQSLLLNGGCQDSCRKT